MSIYDYYITPEEYEIAEKNGISRWTLESRVRNLLWDKQTAITKSPEKKRDWKKWTEVSESNGIDSNLFYSRVSRGMSPERASSQPKQCKKAWHKEMNERRKSNYIYPLWVYDEIKKIGIDASLFHYRIKSGNFTFEEAHTTPALSGEQCARRAHQSRRGEEINAV